MLSLATSLKRGANESLFVTPFLGPGNGLEAFAQVRIVQIRSDKMTTFQISGYLTEFTGGRAEIKIDGSPATVGEALQQLWSQHGGLQDRVLTELGEVRPHVNIFVNSETVRRDQVLQAPLSADGDICIMPAVSGGADI